MHNKDCLCWNCPALYPIGEVDFAKLGQLRKKANSDPNISISMKCKRRKDIEHVNPLLYCLILISGEDKSPGTKSF